MDEFLQYLGLVATLVTIVLGYQAYLFVRDFVGRPKVVLGVIPAYELASGQKSLAELGTRSVAKEFLFNRKLLAGRFGGNQWEKATRRSTHCLVERQNGRCELPIVIQNQGIANMEQYKLTLSFSPASGQGKISIVTVDTETLFVDGLFSQRQKYEGPSWRSKLAPDSIYDTYARLGLEADFLSLVGSLGSGSFEMIHLVLEVPDRIAKFVLFFEVDCPQFPGRRESYVQKIEVVESEAPTEPSMAHTIVSTALEKVRRLTTAVASVRLK